MTVIDCPHGCGAVVDTSVDTWCPSCRRGIAETDVIIPESSEASGPVDRKPSWCWKWHGPARHRMRCRLPSGHVGECDHNEYPKNDDAIIVSVAGDVISAALADNPPEGGER